MTPKELRDPSADLVSGDYLVRFEARTLDDIRSLGGNDEEDDRKFASAARVSEINLGLYRTFVRPWVQAWANEGLAEWTRKLHPLRLQYEAFSQANPFLRPLRSSIDEARNNRKAVPNDNIFWQAQKQFADQIVTSLNAYRDIRDHMSEALFHAIYGSPFVQAIVGFKASDGSPRRRPGEDASHKTFVARRLEELRTGIEEGGPREAAVRALLYVRLPDGVVDERGFHLLQRMREEAGSDMTLAAFKNLVREQFLMLLVDERRAVEAIPRMLRRDRDLATRMVGNLHRVVEAVGLRSEVGRTRLAEVEKFFEVPQGKSSRPVQSKERHLSRMRHMRSHPARSAKH